MKKYFLNFLIISLFFFSTKVYSNTKSDKLYEKIDLFGEVLEKIKQEYVDDIDQADVMDSAINGVLQSLDPYSAYMSPELFKSMQTDFNVLSKLIIGADGINSWGRHNAGIVWGRKNYNQKA